MKNDLTFIFVHGLSGWGSYEFNYKLMPYWGLFNGDLMKFLQRQGFPCCAASVAPTGSAWDRACELYAQLAGKRVDYGEVHSRIYSHKRFGKDFTGRPLIPNWDEKTRLVLLGHSFGGTTARLLSELLAHGDQGEREGTDPAQLSPLFRGGMEKRIQGIVTITSPTNGTTAYTLTEDESFDPGLIKISLWEKFLAKLMTMGTKPKKDGRDDRDYADYDMHIDQARALNERISTFPWIYYFSVPCRASQKQPNGVWVPDKSKTEPMFLKHSFLIGKYSGKTKAGFVIDKRWRENDGLVNTLSARAPFGAPQKDLDPEHIEPGIWNVLTTFEGDHISLQGGMMRRHDIKQFYLDLLTMISNAIEQE